MITGLGLNDVNIVEQEIAFETKPLSKELDQVLYHSVLKKISDQGVTKLIIPSDIDDCDYSYEDLIEHIRTDSNEAIALIPIMVYFEDEDEYLEVDGYKVKNFGFIGVAFSTNPKIEDFIEVHKNALDSYCEKECYKEPYSLGNHDKSNLWGSLTLLKSLLHFVPNDEDLLKGISELEGNLSEWTYFKKLIKEFDSNNLDQNYIVRLKSISSELERISNGGTILIIEDQLKDGWEVAYDLLFRLSSNFKVEFAENESKAQDIINEANNDKNKSIDLILLDVRLDNDRDSYNQDESGHHVVNLSGIKLAKWIRSKMPTIPIIAATASNKSWTLEALLEQGINGYWVKGSPKLVTNTEVGIENTIDLYKKICDTLMWSQKTGRWQKELYRVADIVESRYLEDKAKSLQALLFRSFSPFSTELSSGLQLNLAFINIYSCMNDLVEWSCDIKNEENDEWVWSTINQQGKYSTIVEGKDGEWIIPDEYYQKNEKRQPDKKMAIQILQAKLPLVASKEFNRLSEVRNSLPLIHGKRDASGSSLKSVNASISDINSLINILGSLVERHKELLDKYGE